MSASSWMITHSGRDHYLTADRDLLDPPPVIDDIAHALAQINRFTGHCSRPYSVAEHSLLCRHLAMMDGKPVSVQLACLMHDAHEAYTGDTSSPAKVAIGPGWAAFERRQAALVHRTFGLRAAFQAHDLLVRHYDLVALATERRDLTSYRPHLNQAWWILDRPGHYVPPASFVDLNAPQEATRTWTEWRDRFLAVFNELNAAMHAAQPIPQPTGEP